MFAPWQQFMADIATSNLSQWLLTLPQDLKNFWESAEGAEFRKYLKVLSRTAHFGVDSCDLQAQYVAFNKESPLTESQAKMIMGVYKDLMPWRKGPYNLFGVPAHTEWQSFMKWERLLPYITPLKDRSILDVGCGNGYHMWRMLGAGAARVTGIDPCALFTAQFELFRQAMALGSAPCQAYAKRIALLPLGIEALPELEAFDTVFSMGVLYHRRSPVEHLTSLLAQLKTGGELVLETLVVDGDENTILIPKDRYAKMRNVWCIPSVPAMLNLLARAGFVDIKCVDTALTTLEEQHATELMTTESLADFLDPNNPKLTIEGYQAPTRAVFIAHKKGVWQN